MQNSFVITNLAGKAANTPREGTPDGQAILSLPKPAPVVVNMTCGSADGNLFRLFSQQSNGSLGTAGKQGYLRLKYGDGAVQRVLDVDVYDGSIQLPPVISVQAEFRRFNETAAAPAMVVLDVAVSLTPGLLGGDALMPTSSVQLIPVGAGSHLVNVPRGSRFWQFRCFQNLPSDVVMTTPGGGSYVDFNVPTQYPSHPLWVTPIDTNLNITLAGADVTAGPKGYLVEFFVQP